MGGKSDRAGLDVLSSLGFCVASHYDQSSYVIIKVPIEHKILCEIIALFNLCFPSFGFGGAGVGC